MSGVTNEPRNVRRTLWNLRPNLNIPSNLVRSQNVQHQVGQVVRGVIPGVSPQAEYHPNPYLQHLYSHRDDQEAADGNNDAFQAIEAQLQEVITHSGNMRCPLTCILLYFISHLCYKTLKIINIFIE